MVEDRSRLMTVNRALCRRCSVTESVKTAIKVGDLFPDVSLPATNGELIHLRDYRGKRLFIFMWASW
jgi:hypothetical protein